MLNRKFIVGAAFLLAFFIGFQTSGFAFGNSGKKQVKFKVRIENISAVEGLPAEDGSKYPFAVSPGLFTVSAKKVNFFKSGKKANPALEAQAEDGNPEMLSKEFLTKVGSANSGVFNVPVGADKPAPIFSGGAFEFTFTASEGMKLNLIAMYGQSNDLFYAPKKSIDLFVGGKAVSGDFTDKFLLWDAGTEINQSPGIGDEQAPRQKAANTGKAENGVVGSVKDGFKYPNTKDVLKITISRE